MFSFNQIIQFLHTKLDMSFVQQVLMVEELVDLLLDWVVQVDLISPDFLHQVREFDFVLSRVINPIFDLLRWKQVVDISSWFVQKLRNRNRARTTNDIDFLFWSLDHSYIRIFLLELFLFGHIETNRRTRTFRCSNIIENILNNLSNDTFRFFMKKHLLKMIANKFFKFVWMSINLLRFPDVFVDEHLLQS